MGATLRFLLGALIAAAAAGGPARACVKDFASDRARADYYAARAAEAHDVILGQVVDVITVPSPGDAALIQGDATLAVMEVRKGPRSAGDRIVVPVRKGPGARGCDWELPTPGATYEVYLAFDASRGEYRLLDSASVTPRPRR